MCSVSRDRQGWGGRAQSRSRRVDLDEFTNQLREGLVSGHPDMPTFRFSREDARALTAYLRSIQE